MMYIIFIIILLLGGLFLFKTERNQINIFLIFFIFCFLYSASIPIENLIFEGADLDYPFTASTAIFKKSLSLFFLGLLGFLLGTHIFKFKLDIPQITRNAVTKSGGYSVLYLLIITLLGLVTVYYNEILISFKSYAGNYMITYSNPVYAYLKETLFFAVSVLITLLYLRRKRNPIILGIVLSLVLAFLGFKTNDKDPMFLAAVPYLVLFYPLYTRVKLNNRLKSIIVFFSIAILIPLCSLRFTLYRGGDETGLITYIKEHGVYSRFDARGPYTSLGIVLSDDDIEFKYGKTYTSGFVNWIPRFIWSGRPTNPAEVFAKEYVKDWKPGMGLGYSPLAEAYTNFGILGGFIHFLIYGLCIGGIYKLTKFIFRDDNIYMFSVFFVWMMYNFVMMFRGHFNLPSSYIRYILPFLVAYLFIDKYQVHIVVWKKIMKLKG
ncbi:MAG: oligosaccharide repeat unit polymerase [Bacteroidales bacterium]|nr:oligosaccharide repeat unit polymerase [Bacteroidales bacterium]